MLISQNVMVSPYKLSEYLYLVSIAECYKTKAVLSGTL